MGGPTRDQLPRTPLSQRNGLSMASTVSNPSKASPQKTSALRLPDGTLAPALLHSVVQDDAGHLYYSDEFNHRVVSLTPEGAVRWSVGEKGSDPGEFWYPRGLSIGWLRTGQENLRCLAVCDAWNHRIQFLGLDGKPLHSWNRSGERVFDDVSDIRFLARQDENLSGGHWLVLDRGNHRLCVMATGGDLVLEIGREMAPRFEDLWDKQQPMNLDHALPTGFVRPSPAYDPLYYPDRILGRGDDAIFLSEPHSGRLKQVLAGNLFPLAIQSPGDGIWISGDESGFISWQEQDRRLSHFCCASMTWADAQVEGTPVSSSLPSDQFWLQIQGRLEKFQWPAKNRTLSSRPFSLLWATLQEDVRATSASEETSGALLELSRLLEPVPGLASAVIDLLQVQFRDVDALAKMALKIQENSLRVREDVLKARRAINRPIHRLYLALQKSSLLCSDTTGPEQRGRLTQVSEMWEDLCTSIYRRMDDIQRKVDELYSLRISLPTYLPPGPAAASPDGDEDLIRAWRVALVRHEESLQEIIKEVDRWIRPAETVALFPGRLKADPSADGVAFATSSPWIWPPTPHRQCGSKHLEETACIDLGSAGRAKSPAPGRIARTSNGHLFVSLAQGQAVVHLDSQGSLLETVPEATLPPLTRPVGIAADERDRIWVLNLDEPFIWIYDVSAGSWTPLSICQEFKIPYGICSTPRGTMLVTDMGSDQVLEVWPNGSTRVLYPGSATPLSGRLRLPVSVFVDRQQPESSRWVVDQRNHRLLKIDEEGNHLREIGSLGWGANKLLRPECAAQFSDGIIAVSAYRFHRKIMLWTPEGEKIEDLAVDFSPSGLLVDGDKLIAADWDACHLRVFRRNY